VIGLQNFCKAKIFIPFLWIFVPRDILLKVLFMQFYSPCDKLNSNPMKTKILLSLLALFFVAGSLGATTWFPAKHTCPICGKKNTYQEIGSYGGYIYQWPSKYQYIYWPLTDNPSVYCCVDCSYSVFMWDFDSVPATKVQAIKQMLSTVKLEKEYKDYLDIPMTRRLEIAESIYKILERDDEFWCRFYRVMGYHYETGMDGGEDHFGGIRYKGAHTNDSLACSSRLKALVLAQKMLKNTLNSGKEKENHYIIGAMYFFTSRKDSALLHFEKAKELYYTNQAWKEENVKNFNEYLDGLLTDYVGIIKKEDE
jgi:uncharacterized protein (DUF2225 family)